MTVKKKEVVNEPKAKAQKSIFIAIGVLLLMAVTYFTFIPALDNGWTNWDDPKYILDNHIIKDYTPERARAIFDDTDRKSGLYAPLTYLSWAYEYNSHQPTPIEESAPIYHKHNVYLHVLNTALVFLFIFLLVGRYEAAFVVALLFGVHPMHVESVAWITERKDVLYTFFYLLSLICYTAYVKGSKLYMKIPLYILALVLFKLSIWSKPAAVTLTMVLFLIDFLLNRYMVKVDPDDESEDAPMRFNWMALVDKILFLWMSIYAGLKTIDTTRSIAEGDTFSLLERTLFAFYGIVHYIKKLFVPTDLSCFYPFPRLEADGSLPTIYYVAPFITMALVGILIWSLKYTKVIAIGAFFFIFTIGLTLQFFPVGPNIVTDRYTYVPYIGLFFILGMAFVWLMDKKEKKFGAVKALSVVGLAGFSIWCITLSRERCEVWTNSETLWTDVIEKFPNTSEGYLNRGQYYTDNDIFDKAMVDYESTLQLNPKSTLAYINRGNVYGRNGVYDKALEDYSKAIELTPGASKIYLNRGNVYGLQGDIQASIVDFTKAIELERNYLDAYINRGISYSKLGDFNSALVDFNMALQIDPSSFKTLSMRAYALLDMGNHDAAINDYSRLIQANPNDGNSYFYRGLARYRKSNYLAAIKDYSLALQINPANGGAYLNRSLAYEAIQDHAKALQDAFSAQQAGQNIAPSFIQRLQAASGN